MCYSFAFLSSLIYCLLPVLPFFFFFYDRLYFVLFFYLASYLFVYIKFILCLDVFILISIYLGLTSPACPSIRIWHKRKYDTNAIHKKAINSLLSVIQWPTENQALSCKLHRLILIYDFRIADVEKAAATGKWLRCGLQRKQIMISCKMSITSCSDTECSKLYGGRIGSGNHILCMDVSVYMYWNTGTVYVSLFKRVCVYASISGSLYLCVSVCRSVGLSAYVISVYLCVYMHVFVLSTYNG